MSCVRTVLLGAAILLVHFSGAGPASGVTIFLSDLGPGGSAPLDNPAIVLAPGGSTTLHVYVIPLATDMKFSTVAVNLDAATAGIVAATSFSVAVPDITVGGIDIGDRWDGTGGMLGMDPDLVTNMNGVAVLAAGIDPDNDGSLVFTDAGFDPTAGPSGAFHFGSVDIFATGTGVTDLFLSVGSTKIVRVGDTPAMPVMVTFGAFDAAVSGGMTDATGSIADATITVIPEPASMVLLLSCGFLVIAKRIIQRIYWLIEAALHNRIRVWIAVGLPVLMALILVELPPSREACAATLKEVEEIKQEVLEDLRKARDARTPFGSAWWAGWATGRAAVELGWAGTLLVSLNEPRYQDALAFAAPVELMPFPAIVGTNAEIASLFEQLTVPPQLEVAVNQAMIADAPVKHAISSFALADARLLGAANAGDTASATNRFLEMVHFRMDAVAASQNATPAWVQLGQQINFHNMNVVFPLAETQALLAEIDMTGRNALPTAFINMLHGIGMTDDRIDNSFLPDLVNTPLQEEGSLLQHVAKSIEVFAAVGHSLGITLAANVELVELNDADLNFDGNIDGFDVDPFVLALTNAQAYEDLFGLPPSITGDMNDDGAVDGFDVDPFVRLLTAGGVAMAELKVLGIPEPSSIVLVIVGGIACATILLGKRHVSQSAIALDVE